MGFQHRVIKAKCGHCGREVAWQGRGSARFASSWTCKCEAINTLKLPGKWPNVPTYLFIGADRVERFKVFATPPEHSVADWPLPYSIRSFVAQASSKYGGCHYRCEERGSVMNEPVFRDHCVVWESDDPPAMDTDCHIVTGWSTGQMSCPLWRRVEALCQTEYERKFLHHYFRYAKDRQFPMLIPQPRIGIAERRRPDFVLFLPLQHWNYEWLAVELDGAHAADSQDQDDARNAELRAHGFEVFSVRPAERGYLEEVRRLVERIEERMALADENIWKVAVEAQVVSCTNPDELPF